MAIEYLKLVIHLFSTIIFKARRFSHRMWLIRDAMFEFSAIYWNCFWRIDSGRMESICSYIMFKWEKCSEIDHHTHRKKDFPNATTKITKLNSKPNSFTWFDSSSKQAMYSFYQFCLSRLHLQCVWIDICSVKRRRNEKVTSLKLECSHGRNSKLLPFIILISFMLQQRINRQTFAW